MRARTLHLHLPVNFKSVAPTPNACNFKCRFKCELGLNRVFLPVWADPCIDPGLDLERGGICMEDDADDERSPHGVERGV